MNTVYVNECAYEYCTYYMHKYECIWIPVCMKIHILLYKIHSSFVLWHALLPKGRAQEILEQQPKFKTVLEWEIVTAKEVPTRWWAPWGAHSFCGYGCGEEACFFLHSLTLSGVESGRAGGGGGGGEEGERWGEKKPFAVDCRYFCLCWVISDATRKEGGEEGQLLSIPLLMILRE